MEDCLFCDIVNGSVSSYTLYEDDTLKVILDAFPNSTGHSLIIPKKHYKDLDDIPVDVLSHIMEVSKEIKKLLEDKLKPESVVLIQNNGEVQEIKHFHLHLKPYYSDNRPILKAEEVYHKIMEISG